MSEVRTLSAEASTAGKSRIGDVFAECAATGRAALLPFLTAGYPTMQASGDLLDALVAGGADLIELGIPFSDPLADGATVQHASQIALDQGATLRGSFDLARAFRERGHTTPLILMGYANPFLQFGIERLAETAVEAGVDGFIIPDLPLEESEEFAGPLRRHGRDLIFMIAPTSTDARIRDAANRASGFIYCVSLTGVTGARTSLAGGLPEYIARVRSHTNLPLVIGFGISSPDHVREVSSLVDGVIVASALINHIDSAPKGGQANAATEFVKSLSTATVKDR